MELSEILQQPEGFTPPEVTVKIEKVYEYKSGESDRGPWSFQDLQVSGGRLKLKGLPEFPKMREGMTVTLKANSSKQHGLTGMKVNHEEYQGKTYDKLLITNSCKWEWAEPARNGHQIPAQSTQAPRNEPQSIQWYVDHLLSVAAITNQITTVLGITEQAPIQACFATICIDAQKQGLNLPKTLPNVPLEAVIKEVNSEQAERSAIEEEPSDWADGGAPF
jgi:hypothetical protein